MYVDENENWIASRLTTVDNKWHPFTQFSEWYNEDLNLGYNTCGLLALRIEQYIRTNKIKINEMADYEYAELVDKVILGIVDDFPLIYKRIENPTTELDFVENK